jgi:hypothetical protein
LAFDEELDSRIAAYALPLGAVRKTMFGGTGYVLNGNLMAGVHRDRLVLRLGPDAGAEALSQANVEPFDITGRPMAGWVMVGPEGLEDGDLLRWLEMARSHAESLPPK